MSIITRALMDSIRSDFDAPTSESIAKGSAERRGVMSRTSSNVSSYMQDTASSSLEGIKDLISTTIGSRSKVDLEEAARRSSEEAALDRQESGINKSLTEEDKANEKTKRNLSGGIMSKYDADGVQPSSGKVTFDVPEHVVYTHPNQMSDFEILARTIEAEAAFEPYDGKIAVGSVIANRAASGKYGKGISGVILKKAQFSPWNSWTGGAKGEQGRDMLALKASEDSYKAARDILTGEYKDKTGGATHYVNESVSQPYWLDDMKGKKRGTKAIGNHLFGNADSNATYDGKSWISRKVDLTSSLRPPKERP